MYEYRNCLINLDHITHVFLTTETIKAPNVAEGEAQEADKEVSVCTAYMSSGHQVKFTEDCNKVFTDLKEKMKPKASKGWF